MKIRNQQDFWAGLLFAGIGAFFAVYGTRYSFGSSAKVGPGYFPVVVGVILVIFGAIVSASSVTAKAEPSAVGSFNWSVVALILAAVAAFGFLLTDFGYLIALFVLVVGASMAGRHFNWRLILGTYLALAFIGVVVFAWLLSLQLPLFPSWI